MITALQEAPHLFRQRRDSDLLNARALRALRNAFCRQYLLTNRYFSSTQLCAFLLYFAHRVLERNNSENNTPNDVQVFAQVEHLFVLLKDMLPTGIGQALPFPDQAAFREASLFFDSAAIKKSNVGYLFQDIANLGFAYQIFSLGTRNEKALRVVQSANKTINRQALIAFTQLYTPNWVVDFLLTNTVLPHLPAVEIPSRYYPWLLSKPLTSNKQIDESKLSEITLLDPACGAGQFLFLLLSYFSIYTNKLAVALVNR